MCKQNQQTINKRETVSWTRLLSKAKGHPSLIDNQFLETKKKATIQFLKQAESINSHRKRNRNGL